MKKLALAAAVAAVATTAVADEQKVATDPFASTQAINMNLGTGMILVGITSMVIILTAVEGT